ncbi:Cytochrome P450 734A1-like protein [Drosera capensis]
MLDFLFLSLTRTHREFHPRGRIVEEEYIDMGSFMFRTLVYLMAMVLVTKVMIVLWWRPMKITKHFSKQGIKGPTYHFFIGNMKDVVELMRKASSQPMALSHNILPRVLPFYHHWKKLYGGTYLIWFGYSPRLTISDPTLIREIYSTRSESCEKYESHPLVRKLEGDGLISLKGERWAHRRKTISPVFHMENLRLMIPIMGKTVGAMLDKWAVISSSGKAEIEVSEWFQSLTEEVITRTIFGSSYDDGKAIYELQARQVVYADEALQKISFPGHRFLPTRRNRMSWKLDREIESLLTRLINRRKRDLDDKGCLPTKESNGVSPPPMDLLECLIRASLSRQTGAAESEEIKMEDIVEECKSFFFAGKHTTSNLLIWATILLAMHPQWQQLAREEVLRVCGERDTPTKDDVANLKTLGMIVNETLRLYPPVVASVRRPKADVELGGMSIPKGTELLIPILAVHHDPTIWGPDVSEFNPARFSQGVARAANQPTAFMPFGLGGRQCIGQNLAIIQAKLAMAMILQRFSLDISPSYCHAPTLLMLLYPQYGAPIIFRNL